MSADQDEPTLRQRLQSMIGALPTDSIGVGALVDQLGGQGLLLLTMLLTLVFLIPVSIPGVSTVFGAVIVLIGISRLRDRPLWLPGAVRRRKVESGRLRGALEMGITWVHRLERISRPGRLAGLVDGRMVDRGNDLALILGALLLMAPFGFIPFSNTLPGVGLMCLAIGLLQRDGVLVLLGHLGNLLSIAYFALLLGGGGVALKMLVTKYWPW